MVPAPSPQNASSWWRRTSSAIVSSCMGTHVQSKRATLTDGESGAAGDEDGRVDVVSEGGPMDPVPRDQVGCPVARDLLAARTVEEDRAVGRRLRDADGPRRADDREGRPWQAAGGDGTEEGHLELRLPGDGAPAVPRGVLVDEVLADRL